MDCTFCKIIRGELPAHIVYEDDSVIAFMDIKPINPGHILVAPKRHIVDMSELDELTGSVIFKAAMKLENALRRANLKCDGTNVLQSNGSAAGQEVFHYHMHIIPRFAGDRFRMRFGAQPASGEVLADAATSIQKALNPQFSETLHAVVV